MFYRFYTLKPVRLSDLLSADIKASITDSFGPEITLTYKNSSIRLIPLDGDKYVSCFDIIRRFEVITPEDMTILKYLYEIHNILFYDEDIMNDLVYFNPEKDKHIYDNTLREYVLDCMLYYGIESSEENFNQHVLGDKYKPFFNKHYVRLGLYVKLDRMKRQLFWVKVKLFWENILNKIIFWK